MIESLNGIRETVHFKGSTPLRLYLNHESENYPSHWHTPLEIIMPTKGAYKVKYRNTTFHLQEGDVMLISPGTLHALEAPDSYGERIIFLADLSLFQNFHELETGISMISPVLHLSATSNPVLHQKISSLLLSIKDEYLENSPLSDVAIFSKLISIFVCLVRGLTMENIGTDLSMNKQKEYVDKFIYVCNFINEHYTENISLEQIASFAGFSKYHFSRLFKQFSSITYYKYVTQKRISKAEILLIDPELPITEVAIRCGFSSISSFIRMFKQMKNCTPSEFRTMYTS